MTHTTQPLDNNEGFTDESEERKWEPNVEDYQTDSWETSGRDKFISAKWVVDSGFGLKRPNLCRVSYFKGIILQSNIHEEWLDVVLNF